MKRLAVAAFIAVSAIAQSNNSTGVQQSQQSAAAAPDVLRIQKEWPPLRTVPIPNEEPPLKKIAIVADDGPGNNTISIAQFLYANGIRGTFCQNTDNYFGSPAPDPRGTVKKAIQDPGILETLTTTYNHLVCNHGASHASWKLLSGTALMPTTPPGGVDLTNELYEPQADYLDKVQKENDNPVLAQAPGYGYTSVEAGVLSSNKETRGITVSNKHQAIGYGKAPNGVVVAADFNCAQIFDDPQLCEQILIAEAAGYFETNDAVSVTIHDKQPYISDTDPFPFYYIRYAVQYWVQSGKYEFVPYYSMPGVLGIGALDPIRISGEFGDSDGGELVVGYMNGNGKASVCSARDDYTVWCSDAASTEDAARPVRLLPSAPEIRIRNREWSEKYNRKFWLADLRNEGVSGFVVPTSEGLKFAPHNYGRGKRGKGAYGPLSLVLPIKQLAAVGLDGGGRSILD
jgi:hypothetical protein